MHGSEKDRKIISRKNNKTKLDMVPFLLIPAMAILSHVQSEKVYEKRNIKALAGDPGLETLHTQTSITLCALIGQKDPALKMFRFSEDEAGRIFGDCVTSARAFIAHLTERELAASSSSDYYIMNVLHFEPLSGNQ